MSGLANLRRVQKSPVKGDSFKSVGSQLIGAEKDGICIYMHYRAPKLHNIIVIITILLLLLFTIASYYIGKYLYSTSRMYLGTSISWEVNSKSYNMLIPCPGLWNSSTSGSRTKVKEVSDPHIPHGPGASFKTRSTHLVAAESG